MNTSITATTTKTLVYLLGRLGFFELALALLVEALLTATAEEEAAGGTTIRKGRAILDSCGHYSRSS